jgi:uncharacterized membrane protein
MSVGTNRSLGGIGSILSFVGIISTIATLIEYSLEGGNVGPSASTLGLLGIDMIFAFIAFVGFILFFVAMYGFSKDYGEPKIFKYLLYGIAGAVVTGIIGGVIYVIFTIGNLFSRGLNPSAPTSTAFPPYTSVWIVAISLTTIVWVYFAVKSYNLLGDNTGISLFRIGAKIFFAGAVINVALNVVFATLILNGSISSNALVLISAPGGILNYIAQGIFAKSFFAIKPPPQNQTYPPPYSTLTQPQVRYCPNCGMENQSDSFYCIRCGRKL